MKDNNWQAIALRKQAQRDALIPEAWRIDVSKYAGQQNLLRIPAECGLLSDKELDITSNNDAVDLLTRMRDGKFSVEEVVTAFCKRAAIAQQLTNCLTEIMFTEAIERARLLDRQRKNNPEQILPKLFGLPVSLKDSFQFKGTDATIGMIYFAENPSVSNSALVDILLAEGAVLYCKTNVPQTLMTADSDNNIFGRTLNPNNLSLTAGGSTGGEGALIAMRGSVMGIGTDIAGSIRIPSHCNGIYGFKPSVGIFPMAGKRNPGRDGLAGIAPVCGPMAASARSCAMMMQFFMECKAWKHDSECLHLTWQNLKLPSRPLRVGIVEDDGQLTPSPPMRRALRETKQKLVEAGVEVTTIKLDNVQESMKLVWTSFSLDGSKTLLDRIKATGEPYVNSVAKTGLVAMPGKSLEELFDFNEARSQVQDYYQSMWLNADIDALIIPPAPFTAPKLDMWGGHISYTSLWNLLDYPAAVIPVGKVELEDMVDCSARYGAEDEALYRSYTGPTDFNGAPVTIQVVGMHQEDETLALIVEEVDRILNK